MEQDVKTNKLSKTAIGLVIIFVVLFVCVLSTAVYFYKKANSNSEKVSKNDLALTVERVGKLMVLPTDETPTMATVSDPAKLKDQAFFANAKAGDKVLIYSNARKAILYSPTLNKIIEVAPVNVGANASAIGQ